jgi:Leucine-rich repeat (LRR) protein
MKMRTEIWSAALLILAIGGTAALYLRRGDNREELAVRELEAAGVWISYEDKPDSPLDGTWFESSRDPILADLNDADLGDRELALLRCLPTLQSVYIRKGHYRPESLAVLGKLKALERLSLCGPGVTDESVRFIPPLGGLALLSLDHSSVTDAGLKTIGTFTWLKSLFLEDTAVTDVGLGYLSGLPNLKELTLDDTEITDAGFVGLSLLPSLEHLSVCRTRVSPSAAAQFRGATRDVHVYWYPKP